MLLTTSIQMRLGPVVLRWLDPRAVKLWLALVNRGAQDTVTTLPDLAQLVGYKDGRAVRGALDWLERFELVRRDEHRDEKGHVIGTRICLLDPPKSLPESAANAIRAELENTRESVLGRLQEIDDDLSR